VRAQCLLVADDGNVVLKGVIIPKSDLCFEGEPSPDVLVLSVRAANPASRLAKLLDLGGSGASAVPGMEGSIRFFEGELA
jgi:hypothetical protein